MNSLAPRSDDDNPLAMVPPELRKPVSLFYGFYSDILRGTLGLATRVQVWLKTDDVTAEDIRVALESLTAPKQSARLRYAGELLAGLSESVTDSAKKRCDAERQQRDTEQADRDRATAAPAAEWRRLRDGIGRSV